MTKQILIYAKALLTDQTWAQHVVDNGAQFCALGAIERAARALEEERYPAIRTLCLAIDPKARGCAVGVGTWNDRRGRTLEDVHAAFDMAIEIA